MSGESGVRSLSRRRFLASTAVAAAGAALPLGGPSVAAAGPFKRISLTDPGAPAMLASYQTAIKALLKLPPSDPRNFYRNAFVHTLDCPHGNWWFLPWHRGYLGWWEQTVRSLSGNPSFAFPYWDWTAQPFVPPAFWQGVLNPAAPEYIASWSVFRAQMEPALTAFYAGLTAAQKTQLQIRGYTSAAGLLNAAQGMFFPPTQARSLTKASPGFDAVTRTAVALATIKSALANTVFTDAASGGFGSDPATQHSQGVGFGILEAQPHNNVHNDVGGFMGDFLSPVDPIFMAHHSNIDRLWTVWTAKQQAAGLPTLPTGAQLAPWQNEPFLFYMNAQGKPVPQDTAGSYATIGAFNYTYTRGSGAQAVASGGPGRVTTVAGTLQSADLDFARAAVAQVPVAGGTLDAAQAEGGPEMYARVTLQAPSDRQGLRFHVLVNPPDATAVAFEHPSYAGTFEFFGSGHDHGGEPIAFTVAIGASVRALRTAGALPAGESLRVHVVPQTRGVALRALPKASVLKIEVGSY